MSSKIFNYQLSTSTEIMSHKSKVDALLLRDWGFRHNLKSKHNVDVQVRSGDYFVTLATVLDELASKTDSYATRAELEGIVSDLIYLQDEYIITRSNKSGKEQIQE